MRGPSGGEGQGTGAGLCGRASVQDCGGKGVCPHAHGKQCASPRLAAAQFLRAARRAGALLQPLANQRDARFIKHSSSGSSSRTAAAASSAAATTGLPRAEELVLDAANVDTAACHQALERGFTFVLRGLDARWAAAAAAAEVLERHMGLSVGGNLYVTPPGGWV